MTAATTNAATAVATVNRQEVAAEVSRCSANIE